MVESAGYRVWSIRVEQADMMAAGNQHQWNGRGKWSEACRQRNVDVRRILHDNKHPLHERNHEG